MAIKQTLTGPFSCELGQPVLVTNCGAIGTSQLKWLHEELLAARASRDRVLVLSHCTLNLTVARQVYVSSSLKFYNTTTAPPVVTTAWRKSNLTCSCPQGGEPEMICWNYKQVSGGSQLHSSLPLIHLDLQSKYQSMCTRCQIHNHEVCLTHCNI